MRQMPTDLHRFAAACLVCGLGPMVGCDSRVNEALPVPAHESDNVSTEDAIDSVVATVGERVDADTDADADADTDTAAGAGASAVNFLSNAQEVPEAVIPPHYQQAPVQRIVQEYENGQPKTAFEAKMLGGRNVIQHGLCEEYYLNGQTQKRGRYEYGKKVGEWTFWDKQGQVRKQGSYDKDKQEGRWQKFRSDGSLEWIECYQNGLAHGEWEAYRENGKTVLWRRSYRAGERHGTWTNFYPDESPHTLETYVDGELNGTARSWDTQGNVIGEGEFRNGKRHGRFRTYSGGQLSQEAIWNDGVRQASGSDR